MKKVLILIGILIATVSTAEAQHYVGARAGWGFSHGRFAYYNNEWVPNMLSFGAQWKYYGQVRYIGAFGAEVEFVQRGYKNYYMTINPEEGAAYMKRTYNTINVPIIWHIHYNMFNDRFRVFLNAGIWASYNFLPGMKNDEYIDGDQVASDPYKPSWVRDNPFGYGLLGGIGFNVMFGKWELMLEGRYYFAYGDVLRNENKYPGNPRRSPVDNLSVNLGFFYLIGDQPHNPLPTKRQLRKMAEQEAERVMNLQ